MAKDAEMKDAPAADGDDKKEEKKEEEPPKPKPFGFDCKLELQSPELHSLSFGCVSDIQRTITLFEKAIDIKNSTKVLRAFRHNTAVRKKIGKKLLQKTIEHYVPESVGSRASMLKYVDSLPEVRSRMTCKQPILRVCIA